MATIRDTYIPNMYDGGNVKEIKFDNGDTYHISNTYIPNMYGTGYVQKIEKVDKCIVQCPLHWAILKFIIGAILLSSFTFIGVPWFFIKLFG